MSVSSLLAVTMMTGMAASPLAPFQLPADIEAVGVGEHQVEDDEAGPLPVERPQEAPGIEEPGDPVAGPLQMELDELDDIGLVVDDGNEFIHRRLASLYLLSTAETTAPRPPKFGVGFVLQGARPWAGEVEHGAEFGNEMPGGLGRRLGVEADPGAQGGGEEKENQE